MNLYKYRETGVNELRADRSITVDLFSDNVFETVRDNSKAPKQNRKKTQSTGDINKNNKARMLEKLEDERFADFNEKDWFQYFVHKGAEHGVRYLVRNYAKDYTILKSIMTEMTWVELKLMIDFVWDSPQDIMDKQTVGIFILSKGWINTIYQNSILWRDGKYKPKHAPTHNREWVAEASTKSSGITYGKPIRDDEDEIPKEKKSGSKVRVGFGLR